MDHAAVLNAWTSLCTTDADAAIALLKPTLISQGAIYADYRTLTFDPAEDLSDIKAVDTRKLLYLRDILEENARMIEKNLTLIR